MKNRILIVGASGTVGTELVRILKSQGCEVRLVTSKKPKSNEQVQVDLTTGEGLRAAFENVDRAFLLSPPGYADQYSILSPLIQESKRRGLKKVVLMTAYGANAVETTPFRRAEIELEKSGLNFNIIRPNWFLQNFQTFWGQNILENQKIQLPAGDAKVSFIDARDIAAVAAKLLINDSFNNMAFDLTGPTAVTHKEVAEAITQAIGREVVYENVDAENLKQGLLSAGLAADYVDFMLQIFGYLKEGYNSPINENVQKIIGRTPRSMPQYVSENMLSWVKQ